MRNVPGICAGLLLTAGLMWPSEGAIYGDGLHLAVGWMILAACLLLFVNPLVLPAPDTTATRGRWLAPAAILLLLSGIWLSTWNVFRIPGDRRAALNLAFEWTALAAAWLAVRYICRASGPRLILGLLISLVTGAAVHGIVQHHFIHARQSDWYLQQRGRLDAAVAMGQAGILARSQTESVFRQMDIPVAGPERELFERRLLDSSEPTGPFALANSLGGLLAAVIVLVVSMSLRWPDSENAFRIRRWLFAGTVILLCSYCLILCKTRTAWVGTLVGITTIFLQYRGQNLLTRIRWLLCAGTVGVAVVVAAGISSGALDREVILESPRSLQFRLFYWLGSAGVIAEHPVLGAGPGNFRQVYLKHKPDESSEEILDPHNIFFDSWASAGMLGVAGLGLFVFSSVFARRRDDSNSQRSLPASSNRETASALTYGVLLGAGLHFFWHWLTGGEFDNPMVAGPLGLLNGVWLVPIVAVIVGRFVLLSSVVSEDVVVPSLVAMLVHLSGAGGLQITGVVLVLFTLHAVLWSGRTQRQGEEVVAGQQPSGQTGYDYHRGYYWGAGMILACAAFCTLRFGLTPAVSTQQLQSLAAAQQAQGDTDRAAKTLRNAVAEDQINVDSCQRLAELLTYEFISDVRRYLQRNRKNPEQLKQLGEQFHLCEVAVSEFIRADLRRWSGYHLRAQATLFFVRVSADSNRSQQVVNDLEKAVQMYPGNSRLWSELANACQEISADERARAAASRALQLDDLNHEWGHLDRFLDEETVRTLRNID